MSRSRGNVSSFVSFAQYYSGENDRKLVYIILAILGLSWLLNQIIFAVIAGTFAFGLFLKSTINQMRNNAREAERKNPDFDYDSETFTIGTLILGLVLFFFGLPFTFIGGVGIISAITSIEEWIDVRVGLFDTIEVFWATLGIFLFFFVGLGISWMGLYTCYSYLNQ